MIFLKGRFINDFIIHTYIRDVKPRGLASARGQNEARLLGLDLVLPGLGLVLGLVIPGLGLDLGLVSFGLENTHIIRFNFNIKCPKLKLITL